MKTHTQKTQHITFNMYWPQQTTVEAGRAQRLFQHGQFPDKNHRDISRDIWNFSQILKAFIYLFHDFSRKPKPCRVEPWLANTEK